MTNHTDKSGNTYQSPDGKPAAHGTKVRVNTPSGTKPGTMNGGSVVTK